MRAHICQVEYVILLLKVILADGPPTELRIDALNTSTPNWQMNLLWLMTLQE